MSCVTKVRGYLSYLARYFMVNSICSSGGKNLDAVVEIKLNKVAM